MAWLSKYLWMLSPLVMCQGVAKLGHINIFLAFGFQKWLYQFDISSTLNKGYFLLISFPALFPVVLLIFVILKVLKSQCHLDLHFPNCYGQWSFFKINVLVCFISLLRALFSDTKSPFWIDQFFVCLLLFLVFEFYNVFLMLIICQM